MAFHLPIKLLLSQPVSFRPFSSLILLSILLEGESDRGGAELLAGVKPSQAVLQYGHTCDDVSKQQCCVQYVILCDDSCI